MFSYTVYGLHLRSELSLPCLVSGTTTGEADDVRIRREPLSASSLKTSHEGCFRATPEEVGFAYDRLGTVSIRRGHDVIVDPVPGVDESLLEKFIVEQCLGVLLHQRNRPVFHASAVSVDGDGIAFVGHSGAGKSTAAAALAAAGHDVLTDDVTAVRMQGTTPMITPGVPVLKLAPDLSNVLDLPENTSRPSSYGNGKRLHRIGGVERHTPVPLDRIYVLSDGQQLAVESLNGPDAVTELVRHSYAINLLRETDSVSDNFGHCSDIARSVSIKRLRHPSTQRNIPALVDTVSADLE